MWSTRCYWGSPPSQDAGIWLDGTFDYLPPSSQPALEHLGTIDLSGEAVVRATILEHHRLRKARSAHPMVEAFRRADLTDLSGGLVPSPGVSFRDYRDLAKRYCSHRSRRQLAGPMDDPTSVSTTPDGEVVVTGDDESGDPIDWQGVVSQPLHDRR